MVDHDDPILMRSSSTPHLRRVRRDILYGDSPPRGVTAVVPTAKRLRKIAGAETCPHTGETSPLREPSPAPPLSICAAVSPFRRRTRTGISLAPASMWPPCAAGPFSLQFAGERVDRLTSPQPDLAALTERRLGVRSDAFRSEGISGVAPRARRSNGDGLVTFVAPNKQAADRLTLRGAPRMTNAEAGPANSGGGSGFSLA
jgi:hypothetical protein